MSCTKRLSETAADSSFIYQIFSCVSNSTPYIDRLRFFKQVKDEIDRIASKRQSPEIVALTADWGQGKSTFLDIIEEYGKRNKINVTKISFMDLITGIEDLLSFKDGVYLVDEVESSVDYFLDYQHEIKEFWSKIKELANVSGDSTIYLSMTPSAYSKVFGPGGQLQTLFPETYLALIERIRRINIENPSKLEFILMLKCMLKLVGIQDFTILQYMDMPYWVIDQERRKYVRFFNEILCKNLKNIDNIFLELARSDKGTSLNSEGDTVKLDTLAKLENEVDRKEVTKLYKILMSRIFTDEKLIVKPLDQHVVKGSLIPYSRWIETFPKNQDHIEDFLLTYYDDDFYIFISDDLERVVYESVDISNVKENARKLKIFSKSEAYALSWNFFESVINTNIGGLVVDFRTREIRDKALQFVNTYIADREKEIESLIHLMEIEGVTINNVKRIGEFARVLNINGDRTIILAKLVDESEVNELIKEIKESNEIIHGVIIVETQADKEKLINLLNELAIAYTEINVTTPKKRQLLYLLFSRIYNLGKIRHDSIDLRLGDIKNAIFTLLLKINDNLNLKQLPILKNKRLIQSFNWIIFYPSTKITNIEEVFEKVNDIVNEKFRMYGSKQFHLEDIETSNTFIEDVVSYFTSNEIIKIKSNYIDFSELAGETLSEFSKLFAGFIKQKYKHEAEEIVANYIMYYVNQQEAKRKDSKNNPLILAYQIFSPDKKIGQNPTLDFFVYSSIVTGEIAKYMNKELIFSKLNEQIKKIKEKLDNPYSRYGYFITAKRRGAAIRSLTEMREIIDIYERNCVDFKDIRLCYAYLYLSNLYLELLKETERAINEVEEIRADILKRLEIINKAKKYVKIDDNIEEVEKINEIMRELKDHFDLTMAKLAEKIQIINEKGKTESFKKYLDYLLATIRVDDNNSNLYLLLFKLLREVLNGTTINGIEELKGTVVEEISELGKIGAEIINLNIIIEELEKISPELPKLRENIERNKQKIEELIREIKEVIESYEIN
ncbi:hypothetical protein V6M85_05430 [Sulfolobus tengchongensis]|uniref:KAP NTPase domain-containing protein n=1 Tax=Sulfolobus tengchongensis TaxID=207809 RepID=A0AAX4L2Y8_9CREN